jgi:hypothetical protein
MAAVPGCATVKGDISDLDSTIEKAICAFTPLETLPVVSDLVCSEGTQYGSDGPGLGGLGDLVSGVGCWRNFNRWKYLEAGTKEQQYRNLFQVLP